MSEIVNLRKQRKKVARQLAERQASANRLLNGRSKAERALATARDANTRRQLDLHRIETEGEP